MIFHYQISYAQLDIATRGEYLPYALCIIVWGIHTLDRQAIGMIGIVGTHSTLGGDDRGTQIGTITNSTFLDVAGSATITDNSTHNTINNTTFVTYFARPEPTTLREFKPAFRHPLGNSS